MTTTAFLQVTPEAFTDRPLRVPRVALVGYASSSRNEAPFGDPSWEVWGLNMAHAWMPTWDRLFELHDRSTLELETEEMKRETDHLGTLRAERKRPIYMLKREDDIPCSIPLPIDDLTARFGALCQKLRKQPYFTSTPAFMLAMAIQKGAQEIGCYGIDLLQDEEYGYQRANFEFLVGYALGHGIIVHVPDNSAVLSSDGLYGYGNAESLALLARLQVTYGRKLKQLDDLKTAAALRRDQAKADWNSYDGAQQVLRETSAQLTFLMRGGKLA